MTITPQGLARLAARIAAIAFQAGITDEEAARFVDAEEVL